MRSYEELQDLAIVYSIWSVYGGHKYEVVPNSGATLTEEEMCCIAVKGAYVKDYTKEESNLYGGTTLIINTF